MPVLNTSISGLLAFQRALATTSHNIANVNTPGYSRQRVDFETRIPQQGPGGWIGSGVQTQMVSRVIDETRNTAVRSAQIEHSRLTAYANLGARLDNLTADKTAGISPALQGLFDAVQQVAVDPTSASAREIMIAEADNLAARFAFFETHFRDLDQDIHRNLEVQLGEVNDYSAEIARLNREIAVAHSQAGGPPNDLLDRRDHALNELSKRVDVTTVTQDDGSINVFIGNGQGVVIGHRANSLVPVEPVENNPADPTRFEIGIVSGNGEPVNITRHLTGGSVAGMLQFRAEVLDPAREDLQRLAQVIHDSFNEQHRAGFDLQGQPGEDFFKLENGVLKVALTDPRKIAAAGGDDPGAVGDNENMLELAKLADKGHVALGSNSYQAYYSSLVGRIGTQTMRANVNLDAQTVMLNQAIAAREAVSGVNLEEEAANLMRLQQGYHASAQVIAMSEGMFQALLDAVRR